jgi:CPA1 family monovalent cation:H+ antiporter
MLLFCAFAVTLGTLVIQGLTLRPLVKALHLEELDPIEMEVRKARIATADAGIASIRDDETPGAKALRDELALERRVAEEAREGDGRPTPPEKALRAKALVARRERLLELRRDGTIGDDAFHLIEEELDLADLAVATRT